MKKIIALILTILCLAVCMTACGGSEYDKAYSKLYKAAESYEKAWNSSESVSKYQDKLLDAYSKYIDLVQSDEDLYKAAEIDFEKFVENCPHACAVIENYYNEDLDDWYTGVLQDWFGSGKENGAYVDGPNSRPTIE